MVTYKVKSSDLTRLLDTQEQMLDIVLKFKEKHPTLDYDIVLEEPKAGDLNWSITFDIKDDELKERIFRERT